MIFSYPRLPSLLRAVINFSGIGDHTIVGADATRRIVVHRLWLVVAGAVNMTFKDNLTSPGAVPLAANEGVTFDVSGEPWFVTDANTAFIIGADANVQVSGVIYYTLAK